MRRFILFIALAMGFALPSPAPVAEAASDGAHPRIIVKLKESLSREVEGALPPGSMILGRSSATSPRVEDFLRKHSLRSIKPVHERMARAKRLHGISGRQFAAAVRRRFQSRANRFRGTFDPPDVSRTYILEPAVSGRRQLKDLIANLAEDPAVEYVEEDQIVTLDYVPDDPYFSSTGSWGQTYDDLYGLEMMSVSEAWDVTRGEGVVVAVVDTGIDATHPDIINNVWVNAAEVPGNEIDDDGNGYVDDVRGWDFIGTSHVSPVQDNDPSDGHGHGTHVAGTVAAEGDNGLGIIGVAWGARVMAVKALSDSGYGLSSGLAGAIIYAADNGADVINNSWGAMGESQTVKDAVDYAYSLGAVVVASAGNSQEDANAFYPAGYPQVITVAASDHRDLSAYFSNWGSAVDVAAPGMDILSLRAAGTSMGRPLNEAYTRADGTSMAAPHVSGLAALLLAVHPEYSSEQVRQAVRVSVNDIGNPGFDVNFGYGRVNAFQAMQVDTVLEAKFLEPGNNLRVSEPVSLTGIVRGDGFQSYELALGAGETPTEWTTILESTDPIDQGVLGVFDPSTVPDGLYTLRLTAFDASGTAFIDRVQLIVDYATISHPVPPHVPTTASVFKPGVILSIEGNATGPAFQQFRVEWARGMDADDGWTTEGVELIESGLVPINDGALATLDTISVSEADYYTVRLLVENDNFTSEARTLVYLEPDLLSVHWPQWLDTGPSEAGVLPAADETGNLDLVLTNPNWGNTTLPARFWTFSADGSTRDVVDLPTLSKHQAAVGELDGQPGDEVVVAEVYNLKVYRSDGTSYLLETDRSADFQKALVIIEDIDGDAVNEVLAVGREWSSSSLAHLFAWSNNGEPIEGLFPITVMDDNYTVSNTAARLRVANLDGDGTKEILFAEGTSSGSFDIRLFEADGTPLTWSAPAFNGGLVGLVLADLDNDGNLEVVVAHGSGTYQLQVLQSDGSVREGWPFTLNSSSVVLAIGNLDRDGTKEIIASNRSTIEVLREDGATFSESWPVVEDFAYFGNVSVADIDGDTYPEILIVRNRLRSVSNPFLPYAAGIAAPEIFEREELLPDGTRKVETYSSYGEVQSRFPLGYNDNELLALHSDGTVGRSWKLLGANGNQGASRAIPSVGDFDRDGTTDIAVSYMTIDGGDYQGWLLEGVLTVLTTGGAHLAENNDWPSQFHDPRNTAVAVRSSEPPVVTITSPAPGATITGPVTIVAEVSDDVGLRSVRFQVDGADIGSPFNPPPFAIEWDPESFGNGPHRLTVVAEDVHGNVRTSEPVDVIVDLDVTPPVVTITSPVEGPVQGTVLVSADATDAVGVSRVEFLIDASVVGNDMEPPYTFEWNTWDYADGSHSVVAHAYDAAENRGTSPPVYVTIVNPPVTSITAPQAGSTVSGTVVVSADASDNGYVAKVEFFIDGELVGTDSEFPYTYEWDTSACTDGSHSLVSRAYDTYDHVGVSEPVPVTVVNPPLVSITYPASGATVSGTVLVTAEASDFDGVTQVELYVDGVLTVTDVDTPYSFMWDTSLNPIGEHSLEAKAYDTAGHMGASPLVTVTTTIPIITAVFDPIRSAPRCAVVGVACDSGTLLDGRAGIGPEPNQPNTIGNSCADGTGGSYHRDESNDRITVSTLDGTPFAPGKTVTVEAAVWAYSSFSLDKLDLYYAANADAPEWIFVATLTPTAPGAQVLSATYRLPVGEWQAVRARFRYGGSAAACGIGTYNDHDDLIFAVEPPVPDSTPPTTSITSPEDGSIVEGTITVTADAADNLAVREVELYVGDQRIGTDSTAPYAFEWNTALELNGIYTLSTRAYDFSGNVGVSPSIAVTVENEVSPLAVYDPVLQVPRCTAIGSGCDSNTLLEGRATLGPEPNQPNTIADSCADGSGGTYHSAESSDRIRISTLDGTDMEAGKTVTVEVTVWAWSGFSSNHLDLYYAADANNPVWNYMTTLEPTVAGAQVLSTTYVLPAGSLQAVRARFRYGGSPAACGIGPYNDHDDLVFPVK